ncbi:hypothetical protein SELMODRAFT_413441 [Selaginella moellendorffii]|uniref:Uncharacterized protein n=1 Tax=Selaginella moellendorffii TaxID=88036 RepID=D8RPG9_SELML|nr:hypothetical protein SELMODRAFT_413441 [Selaginella moellendorffii]
MDPFSRKTTIDHYARFTRDTSQVQSAASEEDHGGSSGVQIQVMVDPDPSVSMQEPDGSRECGNAEASYSIGEATGGSAIGGGVELGGRNEAPIAIGGGADLGGGNGRHVAAPKGHRNKVVTMLEADTILNEQVRKTIVQAQEQTISRVLGSKPNYEAQFGISQNQHPIVKADQNSYFKITQMTDEVQKNLELQQIEQCILNSKKSKVKKLLAIANIYRDKNWLDCIANIRSMVVRNDKAPKELIYNIAKSKLSFNEQTSCLELLNTWHHNNDKRYLNHCPSALVYTTNVFLKLLTGGKKLGMYEPKFHCPTVRERELCPWYLELWRQMPSSPFELDLYLKCHSDHIAAAHPALIARNIQRQLHSEDIQENVRETSQHSIHQRTNAFFPSLPTAIEDDLQKLSSLASHKQVHPLSPTGSVGTLEIVIGDYF